MLQQEPSTQPTLNQQQLPKKKKGGVLLTVLIVILVALIGAVSWFVWGKNLQVTSVPKGTEVSIPVEEVDFYNADDPFTCGRFISGGEWKDAGEEYAIRTQAEFEAFQAKASAA